MFLEYFRLREQPFGVTPDPRFLFPSPGHREALASLLYGIETNLGFGTLIADPGMGKTTLLFHILEQYRESARTAFIFNTQCNSYDLLRSILSELDEDPVSRDTFLLHEKFKQLLASEAARRRRVILVIDEAQNLGDMVMETVRLLSNFESSDLKLLHIILAGQSELAAKLARPELSQLRQRIPMITHLPCLSPQDVAAYIDHRLHVAGYRGTPLFAPEAVRQIASLSRGVPREINRLCFNAMSLAYASGASMIDAAVLEEVAADLGLSQALRQAREDVAQRQAVAVNSTAAPISPAAQVWPGAARGPRLVETANRAAQASTATAHRTPPVPGSGFTPRVSPAASGAPVASVPHRRSTLPPIRRATRVSEPPSVWKTYRLPAACAFLVVGLIIGGWAAVNHWPHPGTASSAASRDASDPPPESSPQAVTANPVEQEPDRESKLPAPANSRPSQVTATQNAPAKNPPASRRVQHRAAAQRSDEMLASLHSPSGSAPDPPPKNIPNPPVNRPTVADQGQMEFVRYVRPQYPEDARNRHIEGTVILSATVARDGTVRGVKPVSGDPQLLKAAETAIRDWVYRPYRINGRPVDVDTEIVINFALPRKLN